MDESRAQVTADQPAPPGGHKTEWTSTEFEALYLEHSRAIYYTALRFLGDATQAEDATHDVFLKAFRKIKEFRGQSTWRTWLYRVTINHCLNIRKTWASRHVTGHTDEMSGEPVDETANPLQALETKELGTRIQKALDAVREEYRLILLLAADQELSYDEIGDLIGHTGDAVRGKLHRARKAFLHEFQKTA